jgi:hypothetical protein
MLGDQPPLTPPQLIYQRMLAGDPVEAAEQAHAFLKDGSLEDYDRILLNGLKLAAADLRLGHLDDERLDRIVATVTELTARPNELCLGPFFAFPVRPGWMRPRRWCLLKSYSERDMGRLRRKSTRCLFRSFSLSTCPPRLSSAYATSIGQRVQRSTMPCVG